MVRRSKFVLAGRMLFCVLLTLCVGVSIYFAVAALRWRADFYAWIDATPMQLTVDLTTTGSYSAPFKQTCVVAHGQSIYLSFDDPDASAENIADYFTGLQGELTIHDAEGNEVLTKPFGADTVHLWGEDPLLVGFAPFANGDYTAKITIQQPASALDGKAHELYARNELCGLELMPAYVLGGISFVVGLFACVVGFYTLPSIVRDGLRVQRPKESIAG